MKGPALLALLLLAAPGGLQAQDEPDTEAPSAAVQRSGTSADVSEPIAPRPVAKPASRARGAVSAAPTRIEAHARNVVTIAEGGDAVTEIGSGTGGRSATVVAEDVVTRSRGRDTETSIGGGSGFVSAEMIINEGGTLSIGAEGTRRNGKTCVEIYRNTCIIHFYFRRKKDPCLPGYWIDGRKCRLPSDRQHRIGD
jgi:hypothetical protein